MNDNLMRALRTLLQTALGMIAAGVLATIWKSYVDQHQTVDPTVVVAMGVLLTMLASWAQNVIEDKTGGGIMLTHDRLAGDVVLGKGVGEKMIAKGHALPAPVEDSLNTAFATMPAPAPRSAVDDMVDRSPL